MAGLAGLEGLSEQKVWQTAERFSYDETLKARQILSLCFGKLVTLLFVAKHQSSCFSTRNLVFAKMNLKPAVLQNFVF